MWQRNQTVTKNCHKYMKLNKRETHRVQFHTETKSECGNSRSFGKWWQKCEECKLQKHQRGPLKRADTSCVCVSSLWNILQGSLPVCRGCCRSAGGAVGQGQWFSTEPWVSSSLQRLLGSVSGRQCVIDYKHSDGQSVRRAARSDSHTR